MSSEVGKTNICTFALVVLVIVLCCVPSILAYVSDIFRIIGMTIIICRGKDPSVLRSQAFDRTNNTGIAMGIVALGFFACLAFVYYHDKQINSKK